MNLLPLHMEGIFHRNVNCNPNAYADYIGVNKENCVHDVMMIEDLEVGEGPSYNS